MSASGLLSQPDTRRQTNIGLSLSRPEMRVSIAVCVAPSGRANREIPSLMGFHACFS